MFNQQLSNPLLIITILSLTRTVTAEATFTSQDNTSICVPCALYFLSFSLGVGGYLAANIKAAYDHRKCQSEYCHGRYHRTVVVEKDITIVEGETKGNEEKVARMPELDDEGNVM